MPATYVYAIIPATTDAVAFDVAGLDDADDTVYTLPQGNLAAVVSSSPLEDYRGLERPQAARYLVAHQRVVEAVMATDWPTAAAVSQKQPLLPVQFGTTLPDETWVSRLLVQGAELFHTKLAQLAGLVQMEVVMLWPLQEVFQEIALEPAIARIKADLAQRATPPTIVERTILGQLVETALTQRRTALRERILPSLCEGAIEFVQNPLMDASMVANVALLLDQAGRTALERRMEALDAELGGRHTFRCVGPLPPYSFATVEVQRPSFQGIDAARRCLGLGETATWAEVRHAYHQAASQAHPDHTSSANAADEMARLTQAYQLLCTYTANGAHGDEQTPALANCSHSFCAEAVEQTLLIAIRRQDEA